MGEGKEKEKTKKLVKEAISVNLANEEVVNEEH